MYNSLYVEIQCPKCGVVSPHEIQFKYGNLRRHEYRPGSSIAWGTPEIGDPRDHEVAVLGITSCDNCTDTFWCNLTVVDSKIFFGSVYDGSPTYPVEGYRVIRRG